MSRTLEIPKSQWGRVLELINRASQGRPVRLEVETMELGDQELGVRLPLRELDFEPRGSDAPAILLTLGDDRYELLHTVAQPQTVSIGYSSPSEVEWIAIGGSDGSKTIIYFEELLGLPAEVEATQGM